MDHGRLLTKMPQKAALQTRLGRARVALTRLRQDFAAGRPVRAQLLEARAALFVDTAVQPHTQPLMSLTPPPPPQTQTHQ